MNYRNTPIIIFRFDRKKRELQKERDALKEELEDTKITISRLRAEIAALKASNKGSGVNGSKKKSKQKKPNERRQARRNEYLRSRNLFQYLKLYF